jgi:hypothetical protein
MNSALDLDNLLDHARIHDGLGRGDSIELILECRRLRQPRPPESGTGTPPREAITRESLIEAMATWLTEDVCEVAADAIMAKYPTMANQVPAPLPVGPATAPTPFIDHRLTESELEKAEILYNSVRRVVRGPILKESHRTALEVVIRGFRKMDQETPPGAGIDKGEAPGPHPIGRESA